MPPKTTYQFGVRKIVPKTGQVISYKDGDDGHYQKGNVASPRFVDNNNGTILDKATGLIWIKDPAKINLLAGELPELTTAKGIWRENMGELGKSDLVSTNWPTWAEGPTKQYLDKSIVKAGWSYGWYKAKLTHYANNSEPGIDAGWGSNWALVNEWADSTYYAVNDVVQDNQEMGMWKGYKCIQAHTSNAANDRPGSGTNWTDYWTYEVEWPNSWVPDTDYSVGNYVASSSAGYKIYRCIQNHRSCPHEPEVDPDWETYWEAKSKPPSWAPNTAYSVGNRVTDSMGMDVYICKLLHYSNYKQPGVDQGWEVFWMLNTNWEEWNSEKTYMLGEWVSQFGTFYYSIQENNLGHSPWESPEWWQPLNLPWWQQYYHYAAYDLVTDGMNIYQCIFDHYSNQGQPGMDTGWQDYWRPDYTGYIVKQAHTAAADKEPPNATYFTPHPFNTGESLTSLRAMCWFDAVEECEALNWLGKATWRAPNRNEQHTILDVSQTYAHNLTYFPNIKNDGWYWTSSSRPDYTSDAIRIHFHYGGEESRGSKTEISNRYVLPVRAGE